MNIIRLLFFILFVSLLFSCNTNDLDKGQPTDHKILDKETFTNLMMDVQLLEGHLNVNRVNQVFVMDSASNYYKEVFNRYNISREDYKMNLKYYTARPEVLEDVYKKVEERLVLKERLYADVLIDQPAISPINKNQLIKILITDTVISNLVLDTLFSYKVIKDSVFSFYNDSILKNNKTNILSFQQSFNVMTHTESMFKMFKNELKSKLEKIKED